MLAIQALKCIYDTGARSWSIELSLAGEGENAVKRFAVDGPEDAEMLVEAFEDCSLSTFDPATGEIVFAYEYADFDEEDEDGDLDDEAGDDSEEDASDEETPGKTAEKDKE